MGQLDGWLSARLTAWVEAVRRRASAVVQVCLLATLALGAYALSELRIDSDNLALISEDLPARRNHAAFAANFPNLESALLVVIDARTPELVDGAAERLEARLSRRPELFHRVYQPGGEDFFLRHGLLYRSTDELEAFADRIAALQPFIASLERDPSISSLARLVRRGLDQGELGGEADEPWPEILDRLSRATVDVYTEYPVALSWEELVLRGSALETSRRRVLVVHAALDYGSPIAAARAIGAIRDEAQSLELRPERGVRVRVTGNPALNYEEMLGIAWDIGVGGLFCFALVALTLQWALGSWKLVAASLATLLMGLVWAAAIAAAAVGHLTVVSMSVAILFIGLGVDFAIHLGMQYAHQLRRGADHAAALQRSVREVGSALVLCTVTTAIGFLVFVPTVYTGVAELGLIAGLSMIAISFLTFTFYPALLSSWLALSGERPRERRLPFEQHLGVRVSRRAGWVRALAALLLLAGLVCLPRARFDPNVVEMRDPGTESVQAFNELLAETGAASPWYVDAVARDAASAQELAHRLGALPAVERAITLADYVPEEQEVKLDILEDLAFLLGPPLEPRARRDMPAAEQVEALRELRDFLLARDDGVAEPALLASQHRLRQHLDDFLARVEGSADPDPVLDQLGVILLSNLSRQIERLRSALEADAITLETLPVQLVRRMRAPDGSARVQIFPSQNLRSEQALRDFTASVAAVAPGASGIAFNLLALEEATRSSFLQALLSAAALIALILLGLWRRPADALRVLAPLGLAAVLSVAAMGLLDIPFNFVNVIVIPLMLGIGVDSGIHLVHRARSLGSAEALLGTTTARAVFFSALTTTLSFGSLGLSSHVGLASLGILLTLGMLLTVFANLVVLPALIASAPRAGGGSADGPA